MAKTEHATEEYIEIANMWRFALDREEWSVAQDVITMQPVEILTRLVIPRDITLIFSHTKSLVDVTRNLEAFNCIRILVEKVGRSLSKECLNAIEDESLATKETLLQRAGFADREWFRFFIEHTHHWSRWGDVAYWGNMCDWMVEQISPSKYSEYTRITRFLLRLKHSRYRSEGKSENIWRLHDPADAWKAYVDKYSNAKEDLQRDAAFLTHMLATDKLWRFDCMIYYGIQPDTSLCMDVPMDRMQSRCMTNWVANSFKGCHWFLYLFTIIANVLGIVAGLLLQGDIAYVLGMHGANIVIVLLVAWVIICVSPEKFSKYETIKKEEKHVLVLLTVLIFSVMLMAPAALGAQERMPEEKPSLWIPVWTTVAAFVGNAIVWYVYKKWRLNQSKKILSGERFARRSTGKVYATVA